MGATAAVIVLVVIGVAWLLVFARPLTLGRGTARERPLSLRRWAVIPLALAFLVLVFSCLTTVAAKNVGVLTTFGKPSERTLAPGLHLKWPWQQVTELDGTIKTDEYRGDSCIYVRIGDGSKSCVTIAHRWQIIPDRASEIYGNFRSDDPTESLRDAVISTQLKSVTQDVMSHYNPVQNLQVVPGAKAQGASLDFAPDYDQISRDIAAGMEERYGDDPLVTTVAITVSYVSLSETTQSKIDAFIAEVANTRIAAQQAETKVNEAKGNRALSDSISNDPNVLVSKCFDVVAEAQKSKYQLPAGFSCWPGGGSAVVVPGGAGGR
jgi:regulator of protease activity HflC (stomatin/prohibitin superfamily)